VESVKSLTGNSHVHGFAGDFSDFADIRRFASDVSQVLAGWSCATYAATLVVTLLPAS